LAATALLFEVARVDMNVSEEELTSIQSTAQKLFNLSNDTVHDFLSQSKNMANKSTSYYEFTTIINAHWDEPQKYALVKALWALANADGTQCIYLMPFLQKPGMKLARHNKVRPAEIYRAYS
jgi:uncharacterized tellurite resistance protein B-like protein